MSRVLFEAKNLCKVFRAHGGREVRAVDGVDLILDRGCFAVLSGPSGSGKTTLLSLLGCLDRPTSGTLNYDGRPIAKCSDVELARMRRSMGFLFQDFALIPRLNLVDNISYPLIPRGIPWSQRRQRALELLERLQLSRQAFQRPEELSGGERQRVALARALAGEPTVVLADEPTSNLDRATGQCVIQLLQELVARGTTIIVSTHDAELRALATNVITLKDGKRVTVADGPSSGIDHQERLA